MNQVQLQNWTEEIDKMGNRLELTWYGKEESIKVEPRLLIHNEKNDYGETDTGNMLIHGDNLLVLKALEKNFAGKVKCIYIDPPYNTGSAFWNMAYYQCNKSSP